MSQIKTEVIAVSSGKGGVGKTTLAVNLGISMARKGKNVCLFDADTNLANINILLRESPLYTLQHVLDGDKNISEIVIRSHGISFIPGASGLTDFNELGITAQNRLLKALTQLEQQYDVILVDTSAGIHDNVLNFIQAAHQSIVLITPEPTSLTDSFSLLRMLRKRKYRKRINVVVSQSISELGARQVFKRFSSAVAKYIGYHPAYLGYVSRDDTVSSAVCSQVPVSVYRPSAPASQSFNRLADSLMSLIQQQADDKRLTDVWRQKIASVPSVELADTSSSPVPGSEPEDLLDDAPDDEETDKPSKEETYQQADKARKHQVLIDHKQAIVEYIEDADFNKEEVALTLDRFLNAFFKRFKDYPVDIVDQVNILLQANILPQAQINQMLSVLMLFYKDNQIRVDRDSNAEFLNQQINDYVDEYGQYPFDTIQTLMQSIGMGQVSSEARKELENILNLVKKKNLQSTKLKTDDQVYASNIEQDRDDLAASLKEQIEDVATPSTAKSSKALKDSIGFASRLVE